MAEVRPRRRLIVNADDFGGSASINEAVNCAHRDGILTTASLMVTGEAAPEAVALARAHPHLGVGLHLVLVCGRAANPPGNVPGLVDPHGEFSRNPVAAGLRYFLRRDLREPLRREIDAQFARFRATGLPLDHVNGHLNLHLHPTVFSLLNAGVQTWSIRHLRWTRDPLWLDAQLGSGRWGYRISHAIIFRLLTAAVRGRLARAGIRHTTAVFGLLQNGRVTEDYVTRLLPRLPAGDSELYSHPSLTEFRPEFDALVSPRLKALAAAEGIELIRYRDL